MERPDTRERQGQEFFPPAFLQTISSARRNGEEQFVIFAVGNGMVDRDAARPRQTFLVDPEPEFARSGKAGKIGAEAVAQIHHCVDRKIFGKPAGFFNARNEAKMLSVQRPTKSSRDEEIISVSSARTRNRAIRDRRQRRRAGLGEDADDRRGAGGDQGSRDRRDAAR